MNEGTLVLDLTIPSTWPPPNPINVFDGLADQTTIQITATPAGILHFHATDGNENVSFETPNLVLPDFACLKVAFTWDSADGVGCAINGVLVTEPINGPVTLNAKSEPPTGFRSPAAFQVPEPCNDSERSFLRFILDLQSRVGIKDRFNLLEASAILRRLLLDAHPIIHLVNREYRQQLLFPIVAERQVKDLGEGASFHFVNLCPDFADPAEIQHLKFDAFLGTEVLRDSKQAFTIRDVIDVCANLKGGIHFDEPASKSQQSLIELDKNYFPFFVDASLAALPGIAWTVVVGARPLIQAILKKHGHVQIKL